MCGYHHPPSLSRPLPRFRVRALSLKLFHVKGLMRCEQHTVGIRALSGGAMALRMRSPARLLVRTLWPRVFVGSQRRLAANTTPLPWSAVRLPWCRCLCCSRQGSERGCTRFLVAAEDASRPFSSLTWEVAKGDPFMMGY